jgi:alpha-L-fucosidase 2
MNYWSAFTTNLDVTDSLWNYMEQTWKPRGEYTAHVLYNISRGWVSSFTSSLRSLKLKHCV